MDFKVGRRMSMQKGRRVSTISNPRSISRLVSDSGRRPDTKLSDIPAHVIPRDKLVTYTLAYSTSVEKAFRRTYKTTFFGPLSGNVMRRSEPVLEVEKLPELYSDFVYINNLLEQNQQFARKLLEEVSESTEEPGKLVKLPKVARSRKVSRSRDGNISTTPVTSTKLPQIGQNSSSSLSVTLGGSISSSSDNALQVG